MKRLPVYICCLSIYFLSFRVSAQDWQPIAPNITALFTKSILFFQGDLYLGGLLYTLDNKPISGLARWDGVKWHPVGKGTNSISTLPSDRSAVWSMVEYKGELIIAGGFDSVDNIAAKNIARYDGTDWKTVGNALGTNRLVKELKVFQNELYACGSFETIGGVYAPGIAKWDGANWSRLGKRHFSSTERFVSYQNEIYVLANETDSTGPTPVNVFGIYRWDGITWDQIPQIPTTTSNFYMHFWGREEYNGKLFYASYWEYLPPGVSRYSVMQWDGSNWSVFDSTLKEDVWAMTIFKDQIFVGYDGAKVTGPVIQKREENIWKDVGTLAGGKPRKFLTFNNQLYLCGEFPGGVVYKYDFPNAITQPNQHFSFTLFPNPTSDRLSFSYTLENIVPLQLTLYDLTGKKVAYKNYGPQPSGSGQETLFIQHLAPGMYMVEVKAGQEVVTEKIIKR